MSRGHGFFLCLMLLGMSLHPLLVFSKEGGKKGPKKVIVEYKKYESFDLGGMQIEGDVLTPGDLTVEGQDNEVLGHRLFNRKHFRLEIKQDIHGMK